MNNLKEIIRYYISDEINNIDINSINISLMVSKYAHQNQKRENGELYFNHPYNLFKRYIELLNINYSNINEDSIKLLNKYEIPFSGVLELALLHDVIEDSTLTIKDVKSIFEEANLIDYYNEYIELPLKLITHNKNESYDVYINKVLDNPISSLVKMLDLEDNSRLFSLNSIIDTKIDRTKRYINYFNTINNKYHFVEKIYEYRRNLN